jgi:hypothetical protein
MPACRIDLVPGAISVTHLLLRPADAHGWSLRPSKLCISIRSISVPFLLFSSSFPSYLPCCGAGAHESPSPNRSSYIAQRGERLLLLCFGGVSSAIFDGSHNHFHHFVRLASRTVEKVNVARSGKWKDCM